MRVLKGAEHDDLLDLEPVAGIPKVIVDLFQRCLREHRIDL